MADLPPNASPSQIEEELDFQQVRLISLDDGADDYETQRAEIMNTINELRHRLASLENGQQAFPQVNNGFDASPGSTTGSKRPISAISPLNDRPFKRQTPSPLPRIDSEAAHRTRERQLRAEAAIRRASEASKIDEAYARQLQQGMSSIPSSSSQPVYQATLGNNGIVRPPPRLSTSSSNLPQLPRIKTEGQAHQPTLPHRTKPAAETVDLTGDDDDDIPVNPFRPASTMVNINSQYPFSSTQQPARPQALPPPYSVPGAFSSYTNNPWQLGSMNGMPSQHQQPPLPMSWATQPSSSEGSLVYNALRVLGQSAVHNILGVNAQTQRALNSRVGELQHLIGGGGRSDWDEDYDSDPGFSITGVRRVPQDLYASHQDLYRTRYEQLEQYNPEKTKEEINELLMNIRPDEELPDDLLVSTPSEMTIKLHKYQELGLTWLQKAEDGSNKGGILADDMGLGKTIQMISLIVTHKSEEPRNKTTLIVAPVALLRQWKQEIRDKIKTGRHALKVHTHHGASKKATHRELQAFDVVITTFGSLAAELKRLEKFELRKKSDPDAIPNKTEQCSLIGSECRWYRVILDEAQCIKNKTTQTAKAACLLKATYRFCMTGTPMMNNVGELYSLIKFLKIKPYNVWEKFNLELVGPLRKNTEEERNPAMRKLQTLCRAIMLRRTKKSLYRGKPILVLPERSTEIEDAQFDDDEMSLYNALENKTQVTFNRYLRAGTVGRSYSAILVLLLRLRQACCHPHLIKDFSISAAADMTDEQLVELARQLDPQVVARIKETEGNFECSICMDACTNPAIFLPCGHDTCRECYVKLADPQNGLREGHENAGKTRCPHCRSDIDPKRITDFTSFKRVHMPELLTEEEKAAFGVGEEQDGSETETEEEDSDSSDEDETESEPESGDPTLGGFIVDNDDVETESEAEEGEEEIDNLAGPSTRKPKKSKKAHKSKKAKGKEKVTSKQLTLAELKQQANRNRKAKRRYLRRLREDYTDSAKIRKMMQILESIIDKHDEEDDKTAITLGPEKILIFSQWTSLLDLCEIEIDNKGWDYRRYDGSMNAKMRGDAVDDFKDKKQNVRIMLVSLKAGNAGLNLNVANQVIIMDPFWNPYIEEQAIDRAHRIGQTRPVKVHRVLVPNTVEDRIMELQEKKRDVIEQALDERQASHLGRLGAQELAYLFGVTRSVNDELPPLRQ